MIKEKITKYFEQDIALAVISGLKKAQTVNFQRLQYVLLHQMMVLSISLNTL